MNTHGSVTIEDGNPGEPGDFNPRRKVSVTFSFDAGEGEDGQKFLDSAASLADNKVNELLRRAPISKTPRAPVQEHIAAAEKPADKKPTAAEKKAAKAADKTKADLAAEQGLPTTDTVHKALVQLDIEEDFNPPEDDLGDLIDAPAPITDAEISKAAQQKNALMKQKNPEWQPEKIRVLIAAFAGAPPKKLTDIPAAKRQEFLDKLKILE